MNLQEAYNILGLKQGCPPEEAKKKYKELTKKYHPDINKEPGADDKFKTINAAYQCVSTGKGTDREDFEFESSDFPFGGFPFGFNPFARNTSNRRKNNPSIINIPLTVSFKDSVFGFKHNLKFNRNIKCETCNGEGQQPIHNGCDNCNGSGQVVQKQGFTVFVSTCNKCRGKREVKKCNSCNENGYVDAEVSISVNIPGGVTTGNSLRLGGMGHYVGQFMGNDQYTDAFLTLTVESDSNFILQDEDVIFTLNLSLLEAVKGCTKTVPTLLEDKEITIPALSKNKEEIILPNLGVNKIGNQRVILEVNYPENINNLISLLESNN